MSPESSLKFMHEERFSNPPARSGRLGRPSRPARWSLPARAASLVLPRGFCDSPPSCYSL
eukprot:8047690-Pyramimonas_sp.AAC.1